MIRIMVAEVFFYEKLRYRRKPGSNVTDIIIVVHTSKLITFPLQADVEISFEVSELGRAEKLKYWTDPQILCSRKGSSSLRSGLGPFGLLVFASEGLQEFTSVFFTIFRYQQKYLVLLCSDQSRLICMYPLIISINSISLQTLLISCKCIHGRSSLNKNNDLTTYGTFVDVNPLKEKLSLRTLVSSS